MLLPSAAIYAACEVRRLDTIGHAARDRQVSDAIISLTPEEGTMVGPADDDVIVRRGLEEALACRDMLAPAPVRPGWWARLLASLGAAADALGHYDLAADHWRRSTRPPDRDQRSIPRWLCMVGRAWR